MPRLRKEINNLEEDFKKLEILKLAQKKAKSDYEHFEEILLDRYPTTKKIEVDLGSFTRSSRENWEIIDKCGIVTEMGVACYKEHSTISKSGIVKGIGEKGFDKCVDKGFVNQKESSMFFKFNEKKN